MLRFLESVEIVHATFGADNPDFLLMADDRTTLVGVLGVEHCQFEFCRFIGIAFSCPSDELDDARAGLRDWLI